MKDRFKPTDMLTATGGAIDLLDIDPHRVKIEDIVLSLCTQVRFAGHLSRFYSVGSHTVAMYVCAEAMGEADGVLRHILLHDMHEYLTGDIPSPVKRLLQPAIGELEERIDHAIFTRFMHIPTPAELARVRYFDDLMWQAELHQLQGVEWDTPHTGMCRAIDHMSRRGADQIGSMFTNALNTEFNLKHRETIQ